MNEQKKKGFICTDEAHTNKSNMRHTILDDAKKQVEVLYRNRFSNYHALGWSVFPVLYKSKKPALSWKGYQDNVAQQEDCKQWDATNQNVGLVTGPISGMFILDIDGEEGARTLSHLESKCGGLPETVTVQTHKGWHYYFSYPKHIDGKVATFSKKAPNGDFLPGVDVRGVGGYAVIPPSIIHEMGSVYEWNRSPWECDIVDAPDWLLNIVIAPSVVHPTISPKSNASNRSYLNAAIIGEVHIVSNATNGARNDQLNRSAFALGQLRVLVKKRGTLVKNELS